MPLSIPEGILYVPLDGVGYASTNNKTGLPNAVGNMPNIPAMQNGPGPISVEPSGPFTSFFIDRKTGTTTLRIKSDVVGQPSSEQGNFVDEYGKYSPTEGSFLYNIKEGPLERVDLKADLSVESNPANDSQSGKRPDSLRKAQENKKTGYRLKYTPSTPASLILNKQKIFNTFLDYSGKQFTHGLDFLQGGKNTKDFLTDSKSITSLPSELYLGSFVSTRLENEDPTYLGYDIVIKTQTSPLFNGELEYFLRRYSAYTEIGSRISVLSDFILQIRKFINYDTAKADDTINTYYLKKLSGLDKLVEKTGGDKPEFFTDYKKDKLTLTFKEDVTQNIGYLASLYKTLSWSRINGKQIIPENLLRFDCDIVISEVKKYNRIVKNADKLDVYKDNISKYVYTLYECQMYFENLPHGDSIDMSNIKEPIDDYSIDINYKYSTMKFVKFRFQDGKFSQKILNNKNKNVTVPASNEPEAGVNFPPTGQIEFVTDELEPVLTNDKIVFEDRSLESLKYTQGGNEKIGAQSKTPLGFASP
ncbi:hypothetical protein EBU94_03930, partial [bacterium]|nr:hypothetical protein [bacterium]